MTDIHRATGAIVLPLILLTTLPSAALDPLKLGPRFERARAADDQYVIGLFNEASVSQDPEFSLALALAIENQNMGCIAVIANAVERRCFGTSATTGEDIETVRREIVFQYYLRAAEAGSGQAAFVIGKRLLEKRYTPDFVRKFPAASARQPRDWVVLARERGWGEASAYLISSDAEAVRQKSRDDETAERIKAAQATNPNCSMLRFSGVAVGATPINLKIARQQSNLERHLAQFPLSCQPGAVFGTYVCRGAAQFIDQPGFLLSWTKEWLQIITPIDLVGGTQDAMVYVDRSSARCVGKTVPAALTSDNLARFHALRLKAYRSGKTFFESQGY